MSNIPISSLPVAISLSGSETAPIVQGGTTKQVGLSLLWSSNPANIPAGGLTGQALVKSTNQNYQTTWATISGAGTVQEVDTGTGLTGGPITLTGTISLASVANGTVLANVSGGSAAPIPNTPSAVLDVIGSTRGNLLYRGAGGWSALAPGSAGQILTSGGAGADPAWSPVGSGSVQSVALALPSIFTVTGSPVTTTGTLTGSLNTQSANVIFGGPSSGIAATPTFRFLVGADLPVPTTSALGGVQAINAVSHQWINSISGSGVPQLSQPAFTDISGTVAAAQLPNPSASTLGGVQSFAAQASKWINTISTSGVPSATQPAFTDLSGQIAVAQLPPISNLSVLANNSGGTAQPSPLSASQVLDFIGSTQGQVLYRGASGWSALGVGTSGQVLTTNGAASNPTWATISGTGTVTSVATNNGITGGTITTTGTIGLDTIANGTLLANTSGILQHPTATTPSAILDVIGSSTGSVLYRAAGGTGWQALAAGTNGQVLTMGAATPSWSSAGSVSSVSSGTGLTGGPITTTGTLSIDQSFTPTWTGTHTFNNGTYSAIFTKPAGFNGQTTPAAPIHVGTASILSTGAGILSARVNTGSSNVHSFAENSTYNLGASGLGVADYDALATYTGTQTYDHHISFQSRPTYGSSGTISNLYGFGDFSIVNTGSATNYFGHYAANPTGTGTITNAYGFYVEGLTKGTNNYGFYAPFANTYNAASLALLNIGKSGSSYPAAGFNVVFTSSPSIYKYASSDFAAMIQYGSNSGRIETFTTSSGTAGNAITWTAGPYVANGGNSWTNASDLSLKEDIQTLYALEKVRKMRAVYFRWKQNGNQDIGVIAQEVNDQFPEIVEKASEIWGVHYDRLGAIAIQAINELCDLIEFMLPANLKKVSP